MSEKTLTAPLAVIKVKDTAGTLHTVGKMRNVRITENMRRGRVTGLGAITPSELPALEWSGTVNVGQYAVKQASTLSGFALDRNFNSVGDFVKHLLFNEGVQIDLLQKVKNPTVVGNLNKSTSGLSVDTGTGAVQYETFASIQGFHLTSEGIDVSEGQIGGRDATGEYLNPILYV